MMTISKKLAAAGVAGVLGVTGLAMTAPIASALTVSEDGTSTTVGDRLQAIKDALAGLVTDGTLTQAQADQVAATLDESDALRGHGGGGHGRGGLDLDAAATALGMTVEELRTALAVEGTTLADVAAAEGVDTSTLVDALVAAGTERLTQAVEDGRLTQAEADERLAALPERVAALVEEELRFGRPGRGPRGGFDRSGDGATDGATTDDGAADGTSAGAGV
jgi:hypothetical protein